MLAAMGVEIGWHQDVLVVPAGQVPTATDLVVPGDISAAAFFLVAASIVPGSDLVLEGVGINPTRTGVLEALKAMGAHIEQLNPREASGEPVADLRIRAASLRGTRLEGALIPRLIDEIPVLAVAAACAEGETIIAGAGELRVKESDRIAATVAGLQAMGVDARETPDGMRIQGGSLRGAEVDACGDHRIAMAFAVAGCAATGETVVGDAANVATSFPLFERTLREALHG
jgi:3-phosphoshikimate 1-carboxyvinyltransferase